jgi:hypothetical protein
VTGKDVPGTYNPSELLAIVKVQNKLFVNRLLPSGSEKQQCPAVSKTVFDSHLIATAEPIGFTQLA